MRATPTKNTTVIAMIVALGGFLETLDATILNTAIPAISRSLQVNPVDLKIALISYLITLAIFIPISGWVADKFGLKRVFVTAIGVFTLGSLWCGFASSLTQLVLARSAQGLGGAMMLPLGRLIILRTFPRHEIVDAMNHVIMIVSIGMMVGPAAGGFITDHFSWPWIFWVNIPVGIFAMIMSASFLPDSPPKPVRPFDKLGFALFGGGLALLTFSLSYLSETTSNQQTALLLLCIALLTLIIYFLYSYRQPHPILNTTLFKIHTFKISMVGNLFARLGFGGVPFLLPLMLQVGLGYSAFSAGLLLVPIAFGIIGVKIISLRILRKLSYRRTLIINTVLVGLLLWVFQYIQPTTPYYLIALLTFTFGLLISMQYSAMNSLGYADMPPEDLSSATSIVSTTQQLSQSFGVAAAALLLRFYAPGIDANFILTPEVFHHAFFALGCITLITTLIFFNLHKNDGHQMLAAPAVNTTPTT